MEATTQAIDAPAAACSGCGAALADDQRYCLHCGARQGDPRVAYRELIAPAIAAVAPPLPPYAQGAPAAPAAHVAPAPQLVHHPRDWTSVIALGGLGTLALVLVVGVLIGKSSSPSQPAAAAPQVITVAGAAAPATATAATSTEISEDWPSGKTGYTIELGTLSKDGTTAAQVAAAKTDATSKGAADVGVLDSDAHGSLSGGAWVIYSGAFDKQGPAKKALAKLKSAYPDAKVVKVGDGGGSAASSAETKAGAKAVQDLNSATGDDYQKKSSKLPDTVALPGKPPPKDNKTPGGGSGAESIG